MEAEKVDEGIGAGDARDVLCGEKSRETFLPEEMETLDLAFGLRGRSITQGHAIKSEGGSELGKGLRHRGEKEAVIIDIEGQRQAVLQESARQEVQVGQEGLPGINAGTGNESGTIVEDVEQGEVLLERRQPLVRGGIELPESAGILALPATNGGLEGRCSGLEGHRELAMAKRRTVAESIRRARRRRSSLVAKR